MTRREAKKFAEIINAYADGKSIQIQTDSNDGWVDVPNPDFTAGVSIYRIKPDGRSTAESVVEITKS